MDHHRSTDDPSSAPDSDVSSSSSSGPGSRPGSSPPIHSRLPLPWQPWQIFLWATCNQCGVSPLRPRRGLLGQSISPHNNTSRISKIGTRCLHNLQRCHWCYLGFRNKLRIGVMFEVTIVSKSARSKFLQQWTLLYAIVLPATFALSLALSLWL